MHQHLELSTRLRETATGDEFVAIALDAEVDFINLRFADLLGRWHHVTIPATAFHARLFESGVGFDGSSVSGFKSVERGDMVLLPDPTTALVDDYGDHTVVSLIASAGEADTKELFRLDPRTIARNAEAVLSSSGHADVSLWSPELEFYIFAAVDYDDTPSGSFYDVASHEAGWPATEERDEELAYRIRPEGGYQAVPPSDRYFDLRNEISTRMLEAGIPVKYHHHENGRPGQQEIEVHPEPLLLAADHLMLGKYIVRNTAAEWGVAATFMPKPIADQAGSGLHLHIRLVKDGQPLLHGDDGCAGLSCKALSFLGGILSHGRALAAVTSPSTNSYRRLRPGYEAPVALSFSAGDRSAAIRIPKYATEPEMKSAEFRPADATCNPYLVMSALIAAGLDGMERGIDPRDEGFGPFEGNLDERDPGRKLIPLPASLDEALHELRKGGAFLSDSGIFPAEFVETWVRLKTREAEIVAGRPHPTEYALYFDC
jgi:glutamine synthetase